MKHMGSKRAVGRWGITSAVALGLVAAVAGSGLAVDRYEAGKHPDPATWDVTTDPVCVDYEERTQKSFETRDTIFKTCTKGQLGDFLGCPECLKAVGGKPVADGVVAQLQDMMYWQLWGQPGREDGITCNMRRCGITWAELSVAFRTFAVPGAVAFMQQIMDDVRARDVVYGLAHAGFVCTLWWLGERSTMDRTIEILTTHTPRHEKYRTHAYNVLPYLASWRPSAEQHAALERFCIDTVFADGYDGADHSKRACARYFALQPTRDAEAVEYLRLLAGADMYGEEAREAIRAMGIDPKTFKADLQRLFEVSGFSRETKQGKKKVTTYRAQVPQVAAAIALYPLGDKTAKAAISYWLSDRGDGRYLQSDDGFRQIFMGLPFASEAAWKKLQKPAEKAFTWLQKNKGISQRDRLLAHAAVGLVQAGSKAGLGQVIENLNGADAQLLEVTLEGLGGSDQVWGSADKGLSGVHVGGSRGLKVADAQTLVDVLRKRVKFFPHDKLKAAAVLAIYDLEARITAAGFDG